MGDGEESSGVRGDGQLAHDPADGGTSETSNTYEDAVENGDVPNEANAQGSANGGLEGPSHQRGDAAHPPLRHPDEAAHLPLRHPDEAAHLPLRQPDEAAHLPLRQPGDAAHLPRTTLRNRFCKSAPSAAPPGAPQGKEEDPPKDESEKEQIPSELECAICMKLLIIPVTIPCGHNFCRDCLEKAKEYKNACPLCRSNMGDKKNINILLADLIKEKYPLTYAKRVEEMEMIKREKEKKILKERFDAIKNSSVIPLFKVPLVFGPYFPGEVFDLNIYNEKFIDLIELISSERTFAITSSKDKSNHGDEKMYGIHVKILEQNKTNQVFCIKCVANFRVILYNIIHFHQYENYIASHSPLFDESISLNFFEYNLLRAGSGVGGGSGVSGVSGVSGGKGANGAGASPPEEGTCTCKCNCATPAAPTHGTTAECANQSTTDVGKKKVEDLKKLLNTIEVEDDINAISSYYDRYRSIISGSTDTNDYHVYNAVNYYSCVIFSRICLLCIRYQLNRFGNAGIRLFNSKFRNVKLTSSEPSNEELENFSYCLSSAIISRSILKWRWFKTTNTTERLESITQYFLKKKNKSILALDNSRSPIIHRLFMLDSISSSLLILVFISVIIFVKYFLY
ncbi:RING zinc finger protein, putative [Plasmodium vivax]|uniref:RING zinc finger protein, putative n=1 Tax=Plasmodium vivax TaxID=5855 RepID=A0A1G4GXK5_PLAVI|nr:RING zinc finger protein, putative [Plasmodium vivax]